MFFFYLLSLDVDSVFIKEIKRQLRGCEIGHFTLHVYMCQLAISDNLHAITLIKMHCAVVENDARQRMHNGVINIANAIIDTDPVIFEVVSIRSNLPFFTTHILCVPAAVSIEILSEFDRDGGGKYRKSLL